MLYHESAGQVPLVRALDHYALEVWHEKPLTPGMNMAWKPEALIVAPVEAGGDDEVERLLQDEADAAMEPSTAASSGQTDADRARARGDAVEAARAAEPAPRRARAPGDLVPVRTDAEILAGELEARPVPGQFLPVQKNHEVVEISQI